MSNKLPLENTEPQTKLINLKLERVALCNVGANSRADILLAKRKETPHMASFKTFEDVCAALEPDVVDIITKHIDTVKSTTTNVLDASHSLELNKQTAALAAANAKITALEDEVAKSVKAPTEDDVLKSASPELQALFAKQAAAIAALQEKEQTEEVAKRYEVVKAIPMEEATLKSVLKGITPEVYAVLEAAATAITATVTKNADGSDAGGHFEHATNDTAYTKLEKSAQSMMEADKALSFEAAFAAACTADPAAYADYAKGE